MASFLEARSRRGRWLLRVEDIDPPREQSGASQDILAALEAYGFEWDGPIIYQSTSHQEHKDALRSLLDQQLAYHCGCSRRELSDAPQSNLGTIYPGNCRNGTSASVTAVRVRTNNSAVQFNDRLQGLQSQSLESESGDFVIQRKDDLIAYHLAVVVDDHLQGVTDIVRGIDLMDSTPRQIWLQALLDYPTPTYAHVPVATNNRAQKLSKSFGAGGILLDEPVRTLHAALAVLHQVPPEELVDGNLDELWKWAAGNWNLDVLKGKTELPVENIELAQANKNP